MLQLGPAALLATLGLAVLLAAPASGLAAEPRQKVDTLWDAFPLEPAPVVERLESRRVARPQSAAASTAGGHSDELPFGVLLWLVAAAAGVGLAAKATGTQAVQDFVGDGLARLRTTGVPRVHVPRPHLPRLDLPRPHLPRLDLPRPHLPLPSLPRLPSNRVVEHLADALDRVRRTVWHADVLFWTSAMAVATAFGVLIALYLGGP